MKKIVFSITWILFAYVLIGQYPSISFTPQTFENNSSIHGYELGDLKETSIVTSDESLIYTVSFHNLHSDYPTHLNWLNEILNNNTFIIKKRDKDLNVVAELPKSNININLLSCHINGLFESTSGYTAFGFGLSSPTIDSIKYFTIDLSEDLVVNSINVFPPVIDSLYANFKVLRNSKGNYILLGHPRDSSIFGHRIESRILVEILPTGDLVRVIGNLPSPPIFRSHLLGMSLLPNDKIFLVPNMVIDSGSNISYLPNVPFAFSQKVETGTDGSPIIAGVGEHIGPGQFIYSEQVLKLTGTNQIDTLFYNSYKNEGLDNHCISGYRNFSVVDPNHGYCAFSVEEFSLFDNNYVHLICFDGEGNKVWEHFCGGDANYVPVDVFTLSNGVLFTFLKYYTATNGKRLLDIVYAKFNENGVVSQATESIGIGSKVMVYPNPGTDIVSFDLRDISNATQINIYNSVGKLIKSINQIKGKGILTTNLNEVEKGLYFYQIVSKNKIVESGKLLTN